MSPVLRATSKVHYLAYGSNLHPLRLAARVPSARPIGIVEMPGYALAFHKRSEDGSGKCLVHAEQGGHHTAYGVVYEFDAREKTALDWHEGNGRGYDERQGRFLLHSKPCKPYLYLAQSEYIDPALVPYDWYKALVLAGARFHDFPSQYIASIEAMPCRPDPDLGRAQMNQELLRQMGWALARS